MNICRCDVHCKNHPIIWHTPHCSPAQGRIACTTYLRVFQKMSQRHDQSLWSVFARFHPWQLQGEAARRKALS